VRRFATIGTGSGLDAIAALDLFNLEGLAITDLHPAVVQAATCNIKAASAGCGVLAKTVESLIARPGDLLDPLRDQIGQFDLIYGDWSR
jgi:methylase of polypeptide subunit release factors